MLVVTEEMVIVGYKQLAPLCQQTKVTLNGKAYKRLRFGNKSATTIQWMRDGNYVSSDKEQILEKIFQDMESN